MIRKVYYERVFDSVGDDVDHNRPKDDHPSPSAIRGRRHCWEICVACLGIDGRVYLFFANFLPQNFELSSILIVVVEELIVVVEELIVVVEELIVNLQMMNLSVNLFMQYSQRNGKTD